MESKFEYKCRRCGTINAPVSINVQSAFTHFIKATQNSDETVIKLINFHRCDDGGYGITDLIGYK